MNRAGTPAQPVDLVDLTALLAAYADRVPDLDDPAQRVVFGTSGHRGSSLDGAFTDTHIAAITQAIVEYRTANGPFASCSALQNVTGIGPSTVAQVEPSCATQ